MSAEDPLTIKLTEEEAIGIVFDHLESRLNEVVPKEGGEVSFSQWEKTPEERTQVYREIASEAAKLRLPEERLDGLIQRALTHELNKRNRVLLWEFFAKHNLPESEEDFHNPSPDALGKAMEIFPQAKSIFEEQLGSTKELYEREGNYGWSSTPFSLGNLLLARDLNLSPEEQAMQVEFFLHDFLFHEHKEISRLAGKEEVNRAIQAVIEEWEFPQERVEKVVQTAVSCLAKGEYGEDYNLLTLKDIQERASFPLKTEETDWSCFGPKDLAQAFIRTMHHIEEATRNPQIGKGQVAYVFARSIYEAKKEEWKITFEHEVNPRFRKMANEEFLGIMNDYYLEIVEDLSERAGVEKSDVVQALLNELWRRRGPYWTFVLQGWQLIEKLIPEEEDQLPFKKELLIKSWDGRFLPGGIGVELEQRQQLLEMATQCGLGNLVKKVNDEGFDRSVLRDKRNKARRAESERKEKKEEARLKEKKKEEEARLKAAKAALQRQ